MTVKFLIIAVHGTFAGEANLEKNDKQANEEWWHEDHEFSKTFIKELQLKNIDSTIDWKDFQWSGANKDKERLVASKELYQAIKKHTEKTSYDRIILIGHSHGGNIINLMLDEYDQELDVEVYTLGTPFSHMRGIMRPIIITMLLSGLVATVLSLILIDLVAQFEFFEKKYSDTDKFKSLHFWKFIPPIFILLMISWRIFQRKIFIQNKKRKSGDYINNYRVIYHLEDEAIAALSVIPQRLYNFDFIFKGIGMLLTLALFLWASITVISFNANGSQDEYFNSINWLNNAEFILFFMALSCFIYPIILMALSIIIPPVTRVLSWGLNRFLYNNGLGNDAARIAHMKPVPEGKSEHFYEVLSSPKLTKVFSTMLTNTNTKLGKAKTYLLQAMNEGDDLFTALNKNSGKFAEALVHCDYFSEDMAKFIVSDILSRTK